jgi:hypothetical protein
MDAPAMNLPIDQTIVDAAAQIAGGLLIGLAAGTAYFTMLWRGTLAIVHHATVLRVVMLQLARIAVIGAALTLVALYGGGLSLIATAIGVVGARELVLRRTGARP